MTTYIINSTAYKCSKKEAFDIAFSTGVNAVYIDGKNTHWRKGCNGWFLAVGSEGDDFPDVKSRGKLIKSLKALKDLVAKSDGSLYVCWSEGYKCDKYTARDRGVENGLSGKPIDASWADDDESLADEVTEYIYNRVTRGDHIKCHIYKVSNDGNDIEPVATLSMTLVRHLLNKTDRSSLINLL